ncbi:MAG: aminotransferase class V-fold PLP-dependent enzyme [Pseudonocardia sp.]|nr:aminotransferase class V-fold PLP-dependent enzyme [Pseudonocardia sp.]
MSDSLTRAARLDARDPLAGLRDRFVGSDDRDTVYLEGNALGRPPRAAAARMAAFVEHSWGGRLIRGWPEGWFDHPMTLGDRLGDVALGAGPGQVVVSDTVSVLLYALLRAAVGARPGRREILVERHEFATDRWVVEGVARECGLDVRWLDVGPDGVTAGTVRDASGPATTVAVLSQVSHRSGHLADVAEITRALHDVGALALWDLSHGVGAVPSQLDDWGVDLAVGCTYKYLNGGPGAPAFAYVAAPWQEHLRSPVQGWMGAADPFGAERGYRPAPSVRRFLSGTPPILATVPLTCTIDLLATTGMVPVRARSVALGDFAVQLADELPADSGVRVAGPREGDRRGSHVLLACRDAGGAAARLAERGVLVGVASPDHLRLGLSPMTTSFDEVARALVAVGEVTAGSETGLGRSLA